MINKILVVFILSLFLISCSKKEPVYNSNSKNDPFRVYQEGMEAFQIGDYFFAEQKFSEAELNFTRVEFAAKAAIMSSYSLYGINFYNEALESLDRYLKKYPADKNVVYAHYLIAIIYYEQIEDEKRSSLLLQADKKTIFLKNSQFCYAIDQGLKI